MDEDIELSIPKEELEAVVTALCKHRGEQGFRPQEVADFINGWWLETTLRQSIKEGILEGTLTFDISKDGEPVIGLSEWRSDGIR